jgi:ligand-binding sensor domain-containing protein/serine phosphatase RsbU (regulator of sigma subunit)
MVLSFSFQSNKQPFRMPASNLSRIILKILFLLVIVTRFAGENALVAQTYFFDNYSTPQGFESKVYTILQDNHHYVWLGTQAGVSRFDGSTFISYSAEEGLAPGGVRVLFADDRNNIWMGHEGGGITRFNGKSFERITVLDTLLRSNITSIIQDRDNQLWITTELNGALMIRNPLEAPAKMRYEHFLKGKSLGDQVFSSLKAHDGTLYFVTNAGIRKYNKTLHTFESFTPPGMFTYFITTVMFQDSRDNLWFGTYNGGLSKLNHQSNKFEFYDKRNGLAANWVSSITEDRKGNIWIGHWSDDLSSGGISRIGPEGQIKIFNTSNGLHDNRIWKIIEDGEGNMLIGTTEHGLDIFKGERFVSFSTNDGLLNSQVYAITGDPNGNIWFGTNEGITIYGGEGKQRTFQQFNQSNRFISNQIRFFRKDKNNDIWIGTADQGVIRYNASKQKFEAQAAINSFIPYQTLSKGIGALEIDQQGHLWIGTLDGLVEYDIHNNRYIATHTQGNGLAGNDITALYADTSGDLWIGSRSKGLTRRHQGKFSIITQIKSLTPTCITGDRRGNIWIGTESRGVLKLQGDSIRQYSVSDGLLANLVNLLVCDKDNNMYVGTNRGLNKIDPLTNQIFTFTRRTGFVGIETKNNAGYIDRHGMLWFGTANGAIRCDNHLEETGQQEPQVRISNMLVKGVETEIVPGLRLSSTENDITFRYISISLANPEGISYQVLLEGLHDSWLDQKNQSTIVFNKLRPGKYTLRVRAKKDNGMWTSVPATYSFRILAPFYQRGYFIFSMIILVLASIIVFIRVRERNLVQEKKILEERVNERTLALSEANTELSNRNKDILDSITYAKRIQLAILPAEIPYRDTFIVFKPKDIVSGDFYWMNRIGGKEFLIAVDCTGHGVPGAFMSFIGYTSLNKIIIEQGIYKPSGILNRLNEEVATSLHQKGEDIVNDGMDIALICFSPETGMLEYAGAFNPLILIRHGELTEIKADRFAIGRSTGKEKEFTNHELQIESGDTVYLYSDGYADQFGGPEGKKFKTTALKEKLLAINLQPAENQRELLERTFEEWKGPQEQIDDVLIVGRKF